MAIDVHNYGMSMWSNQQNAGFQRVKAWGVQPATWTCLGFRELEIPCSNQTSFNDRSAGFEQCHGLDGKQQKMMCFESLYLAPMALQTTRLGSPIGQPIKNGFRPSWIFGCEYQLAIYIDSSRGMIRIHKECVEGTTFRASHSHEKYDSMSLEKGLQHLTTFYNPWKPNLFLDVFGEYISTWP